MQPFVCLSLSTQDILWCRHVLQRVREQLWTLSTGSQAVGRKQVITGPGYLSLPVQAVFLDQAIKNYCGIYSMEIELSLWEEQKTLDISTSSQM